MEITSFELKNIKCNKGEIKYIAISQLLIGEGNPHLDSGSDGTASIISIFVVLSFFFLIGSIYFYFQVSIILSNIIGPSMFFYKDRIFSSHCDMRIIQLLYKIHSSESIELS